MLSTVSAVSAVGCLSGCLAEPLCRYAISRKRKKQRQMQPTEETDGTALARVSALDADMCDGDSLPATESELQLQQLEQCQLQLQLNLLRLQLLKLAVEGQAKHDDIAESSDSNSTKAAPHLIHDFSEMASPGVESIYASERSSLCLSYPGEARDSPEESTEANDSESHGTSSRTGDTTPEEVTSQCGTDCDDAHPIHSTKEEASVECRGLDAFYIQAFSRETRCCFDRIPLQEALIESLHKKQ